MLLQQQMLEKERLKQKYSDKMAVEKERNTFETHKRLKEQEIDFKVRLRDGMTAKYAQCCLLNYCYSCTADNVKLSTLTFGLSGAK
jgi:hypothetical protein